MVDIVIVNWNSGDYLRNCISSVFSNAGATLVNKVFVIDNNSADSSCNNIAIDKRIEVIRNRQNNGFAKACNQGFHLCTAEYVLLLNPDAMLMENTLIECNAFMIDNKEMDVLGCCLKDDHGHRTHSCSRFPTPVTVFFDATGLSKVAPKKFTPATRMTDWDHLQSCLVSQVMGAFMFMKTSLFEKIGYFDERFFVYYEEVDFSKRLQVVGGKIFYDAKIEAIHSGEGTTESVKGFRLFLNLRSRLKYARKHFSIPGFLLVWFSTFFIEPFSRIIFLLFTGKTKEIKAVLEGFWLLIKNKPVP